MSPFARQLVLTLVVGILTGGQARQLSTLDRQRGHLMLKFIQEDLAEHYVDPSFRNLVIPRMFADADAHIDTTTSLDAMYALIGGVLLDLHDSHTAFVPPERARRLQRGWDAQMIGDTCFITAVSPGSDAESKGLRPGTVVIALDDKRPTRESLQRLDYTTRILCPSLPVTLTVRNDDGSLRHIEVLPAPLDGTNQSEGIRPSLSPQISRVSRNRDERTSLGQRIHAFGDDLIIWKMANFDFARNQVDAVLKEILNAHALVLDLRSNSGGSAENLSYLAGYFFDNDLPLCYLHGRGQNDSVVAGRREEKFRGELFVLVDSKSTSSAEVFARTVQTTRCGLVLGDGTAGMVSKADYFPRKMGFQNVVTYGTFITTATVTMPDGTASDDIRVTPNVRILPTSSDLAGGLDPVLAHAAQLGGICISPKRAGGMFKER